MAVFLNERLRRRIHWMSGVVGSLLLMAAICQPERAERALRNCSAASFEMLRGATLRGRVRTRDGAPIAAARVCVACASCTATAAIPTWCERTDHEGAWSIRAPFDASVSVTAMAVGHRHGQAKAGCPIARAVAEHEALDISLEQGGVRVTGTVSDVLGRAVANARVQLRRREAVDWSTLETPTDADGHFELWTAPGRGQLRAEASGYAPAMRGIVAPSDTADLRLTPASTLRGRVADARNGDPVPDVRVTAHLAGAGLPRTAAVTSDQAGRFELSQLEPGLYGVVAESAHWRGASARPQALGPSEVIEDVVVSVTPAVSLHGRVLIGSGSTPCTHGRVALTPPPAAVDGAAQPSLPSVQAPIESDGQAQLRGLLPGRYLVTMQCDEHTLREGPTAIEVADRDLEATWRVARGFGAIVRVRDALNRVVAGAQLELFVPPQPFTAGQSVVLPYTADAQGRAEIPASFAPGTYRIAPAYGLSAEPLSFQLGDAAQTSELTLQLHGSGTILVEVTDARGRGVSGLELAAWAPALETQATRAVRVRGLELGAGRYRLGPLSAGCYRVEVHDGVNAMRELSQSPDRLVDVRPGQATELKCQLARSGRIEGKVVDAAGEAQANVRVSASASRETTLSARLARMSAIPAQALTDADGRFAIEGLELGASYTLQIDGKRDTSQSSDVLEGQRVTLVLPTAANRAAAQSSGR